MTAPVYNLHNHTPFSDGAYTIDEICEAHLDLKDVKVTGLAIADHLFRTPSSREIKSARDFQAVFRNETRQYVEAVHAARERWQGKLDIVCGCEINWPLNKDHFDVIRTMLDGVDFVLFEFLDWAALTQLANQARRWPCPVGLAHTDVAKQFPNTSIDQVVRTMSNARIFYEVNTKLMPLEEHAAWFRALPNHRVRLTIGTDTHDDLSCLKTIRPMVDFVVEYGLEEKLFVPRARREEPVSQNS
ncbi:MAG: hypothetical protein D6744_06565 [Planctomycetota bacterium]|nr:MAG: hypothetical protein D6744_06565 [Planctomycetota bacterium]